MGQKLKAVEGQPNLALDLTSGIFYVRVMIRGRVKYRSTRKTVLKAAISEARRLLGQLEEGREEAGKIPTLQQFWEDYYEAKEKSLAPRTLKKIKRLMEKHVLPQFGEFQLDEIDPMALQRFLAWRQNFISAPSATTEGALLHAMFNVAVETDKLAKSPMRWFKQKRSPTRDRVLSPEDQDKLEAIATPEQRRWLRFRLATGVRCEELEGIVPDRDIDWVNQRVMVTGKGYHGKKKTRWVPFIPEHMEEIRELVEAQVEFVKTRPRAFKNGRERLFPQGNHAWRDQLERLCPRAGVVPAISPHILRHTFATRYLKGGGDIYIVSKILGHSSVSVTEKVYAHLLTEDLRLRSAGISVL